MGNLRMYLYYLCKVTYYINNKTDWHTNLELSLDHKNHNSTGSVCATVRVFTSERPKPEFSAETGTGTEIIPVRFRLVNSYRNRNGPLLLL